MSKLAGLFFRNDLVHFGGGSDYHMPSHRLSNIPLKASILKRMLVALTGVLSVAVWNTGHAQNPGDTLLTELQIHTIKLYFAQPGYWEILSEHYNEGQNEYIAATAIVNGVSYDSVGARLKGCSSYGHPNDKKSFHLSFDEYKDGQRIDGLKALILNNTWGDPTLIREKLHLDFCRDAGIAAPRANFARLYVNDSYFGVYSLIDNVDKRMLVWRYGDTSGDLFKAVDGCGVGDSIFSDFRWRGDNPDDYVPYYDLKTDGSWTAWPALEQFIDTLTHSADLATSLNAAMNLPAFYRAVAADNLFANLDAYLESGRNFYVYFDPVTGKMEWIVWDVSMTFGVFGRNIPDKEHLSVTHISSAEERPLLGAVLNTPALRNGYLRTYGNIFYDLFSSSRLFARIDSVANFIRPYVYGDPRKMYTNEQFEENLNSDIDAEGGDGPRKPGLKSFIALREASVASQLAALGITDNPPVYPGEIVINEFMALNTSIANPSGVFSDWVELHNTTAVPVNLGGLFLTDDPAVPTKWQFPDTSIAANGYVIVWADGAPLPAGCHANFQLSSSGGTLLLSNADVSTLDSVGFGTQSANRTMARIPNGAGPFLENQPTFNANNGTAVIPLPSLTEVILPQFIQGNNGTNSNRIPFAYRMKISNLLPATTYRYFNQVVLSADPATGSGSGNCIFVTTPGTWVRTSNPSLATTGAYGQFTTNPAGEFEGWFVSEPTGNVRFTPGNYLFMRIMLNDGGSGTSVAMRLTTKESVRVLVLDAAGGNTTGTGLRCTSSGDPGEFVFAYADTGEGQRPLAGSFVESDGSANTSGNNYTAFYATSVDMVPGAFGMILPNALPTGVRRFTLHGSNSRAVIASALSPDGVWAAGVSTVNPSGGATAIVLPTALFPRISARTFIQGAFSADSMRCSLGAAGRIPLSHPYAAEPWLYAGTESVANIPPGVVDWLLVELRTGTGSATTVSFRAAFLRSNGTVVDTDGVSPVSFRPVSAESCYVVLRHRNHIPIMSSSVLLLCGARRLHDFSTDRSKAFGDSAQIELGPGVFGMIAGDADASGDVSAPDRTATWNHRNKVGYLPQDCDLTGDVSAPDRTITWNNRNQSSRVPQ